MPARPPTTVDRPPRSLPAAAPEALVAAAAQVLATAGLRPPGIAEMAERLATTERECAAALAALRARGLAIEAGGLSFDAAAAAAARRRAIEALAAGPMAIGALRDLWGVGRRHAVALAEHLDLSGATRRTGDLRALRRGAATTVAGSPAAES